MGKGRPDGIRAGGKEDWNNTEKSAIITGDWKTRKHLSESEQIIQEIGEGVSMYQQVEEIFHLMVRYAILVLEAVGVVVILVNTIRSIGQRLKQDKDTSRWTLTEGISSGLGFLLSSEVLKTIVAPDWKEIGMTCAILAMRAGMTFLIKWEERESEKQEEKQH